MQKEGCRIFGGRSWDCEITTRLINCLVNGQPAVGFIEFSKPYLGQCYIPTEVSLPQLKETGFCRVQRVIRSYDDLLYEKYFFLNFR